MIIFRINEQTLPTPSWYWDVAQLVHWRCSPVVEGLPSIHEALDSEDRCDDISFF